MEIGTLIRELGGGMWISAEIFILTLLFSLPLGLVVAFGRMSKIAPVKIIHINYERNTADVAAYGGVFRTLLSVWNANFHRISYDSSTDWFCN